MTDVTIKTLAAERQTSVERLVQQFADAGIRKSADDSVSAQEKQTLIDHLNQKNSGPDKLTLQRKTRSTLNIPGTGGKSKIGTNRSPQETHLCETRSARG